MVRTTRRLFFRRTTTPSIPASGPDRMRALCPTVSKVCGSAWRRARPARSAAISASGNEAGWRPVPPTKLSTPGTCSTSHALAPVDAHKKIAGKQRQIQCDLRAVSPLALRTIKGQIMLNSLQTQVLTHALLMAGRGVDCKPLRRQWTLRRAIRPRSISVKNGLLLCNLRQLSPSSTNSRQLQPVGKSTRR